MSILPEHLISNKLLNMFVQTIMDLMPGISPYVVCSHHYGEMAYCVIPARVRVCILCDFYGGGGLFLSGLLLSILEWDFKINRSK